MEPDPFKQNKSYWQLVFLAYSRPHIYQKKALQDNSVYCKIISVNPRNIAFTEQQCFYPSIFFSSDVKQDKLIFIFFSMENSWRKKNTCIDFFLKKPKQTKKLLIHIHMHYADTHFKH